MLSLMKRTIMESALRHFAEKGYVATSIQDIADDCGIAKGSLYKFFPSKEDLFIEVHKSQQADLYEEMDRIRANGSLSLKESFIRETEHRLQYFLQNKFIMQEIKELNAGENKITPLLLRMRTNFMHYLQTGLSRIFGSETEPYIWDLVAIYMGMIREYMILLVFENKPIVIRDVAVFVVDRMEDVAAGIRAARPKPILHEAIMKEYTQCNGFEDKLNATEHRTNLLENLVTTIAELAATNIRKKELTDAVMELREQLELDSPHPVIVEALLHFMASEPQLISSVKQLRKWNKRLAEEEHG
jgi:AcrR family transcriptional regulator